VVLRVDDSDNTFGILVQERNVNEGCSDTSADALAPPCSADDDCNFRVALSADSVAEEGTPAGELSVNFNREPAIARSIKLLHPFLLRQAWKMEELLDARIELDLGQRRGVLWSQFPQKETVAFEG